MAPKQNQRKQKPSSSKGKPSPATSGPKLQISADNENRLRRLLLNSGRSSSSEQVDLSLSKEQKSKKFRSIYEKLSCEGFSDDQIELSLSSLKDRATLETALDWLCLNLRGNELPLKFSVGTSLYRIEGASVNVLSKARQDWVPPADSSSDSKQELSSGVSFKIKERRDDNTLDLREPSQADWIRQYMQQQEEDESEMPNDNGDESCIEVAPDPRACYESLVKEYHVARLEALNAKEKGDKKSQDQAGLKIRKLKQAIAALGFSDDILALGDEQSSARAFTSASCDNLLLKDIGQNASCDTQARFSSGAHVVGLAPDEQFTDQSREFSVESIPTGDLSSEHDVLEDGPGDVEIGDFFVEDSTSAEVLPSLGKKETTGEVSIEKNLEKLNGIWKKGDPLKIPKAVLHQLCKRSGWEAPKFNRVAGNGNFFCYTVSVLCKASGRGKGRKAGGLVTLRLPDLDEISDSVEDAQNRVSAFALGRLFPDLPVQLLITEPYASFVKKWKEEESPINIENSMENRRVGFVESLLNSGSSNVTAPNDAMNSSLQERHQNSVVQRYSNEVAASADSREKLEGSYLRKQHEKKKAMEAYKDMLKTRAALPIAELRGEILQLLEKNSVLIVCGETGCGKTTQVPQFILDDVIESGRGGQCSIICTQPRRIAAISVAERVSQERCESSLGSNDSLVGYQVRLDSARNRKTKLLFCSTGILLRKIAGDTGLLDVSHIIVDEVHERSSLGDFLLIVLKNLVEKKPAFGMQNLKVILMSATVDSNLFSRYFFDCPVVTAQGRTHPVQTYFLEDVYECMNYRLASDSPASMEHALPTKGKFQKGSLKSSQGKKKNLLFSSWGDESILCEELINPSYIPDGYQSYSEQTQLNLKRLNEDVIDFDLLEDLVCYVDETCAQGAILIFLPGVPEIYMLLDKLVASYRFSGPSSDWIFPLHSSIASSDQRKVFLKPPDNIRKVIIATNIAETSITIDDVVYVIDCGRHKENRYDSRKKLSSMVEDWISRANARQRRGRAGRVKPGTCFCLYTRHRFENIMRPFQVPEMLRMPLTELCLQIKVLSLGNIKSFLSMALEPPKEEAMSSAISTLYEVGAIEGNEELTHLGYHLAKLPVDVLIGKMLLFGGIFGCLSPILSISAFLSYKSPFVHPKDERQNAENAKMALLDGASDADVADRQSDHLIMMISYNKWEKIFHEKGVKAAKQFCNSYFLSSSVMYMIRDMRIQFGTLLADIGLIHLPKNYQGGGMKKEILDSWFSDKSQPFNAFSHQSSIVKVILCAGLYPNVAATEGGITGAAIGKFKQLAGPAAKNRPIWYDGKREVHIHPSSVNYSGSPQYPFLVFLEKVETNKVFLRDTTIISPFCILLFGGSIDIQHQTGLVTIDGWLQLAAPAQTAVLFKELRLTLHSILQELIQNPQAGSAVNNEVIKSIIHLLLEEAKPMK